MKSAAILAAILASIPTNRDVLRVKAAVSVAKMIRVRTEEASNAFPPALANPAVAVKVHPVDAVAADIAELVEKALTTPRAELSEFAPRLITMKIHPDKIREVIGKAVR